MAKVMISMPDALLAQVDDEAARRGTTRSGLVRELAEAAIDDRIAWRIARMRELRGGAADHGGRSLEQLKAGRPS